MPRRNPDQPSYLQRTAVPQMPEGYYSSGPNPNLARFVAEHGTPYDPAADTYRADPFDQPITTTKATAIYNMHTYWSKKPHDAIRQYIRHYTQPGDLVLDPFCGSGGTALAALMEGRSAIAIDLSPAATFIAKNYCTPVDVEALERAFERLQQRVKPELDWLYETRCDRCDGRAMTSYTVYSQVFRCGRCLNPVPLFDCLEAEGETAAGKPKTITVCPTCWNDDGVIEEISTTKSEKLGAIPVLVSYECLDGCKPKRGERRHNDEDPQKRQYFEQYDLGKLAEIDARRIPHWTPPHRMMNVESDTEPWGAEWRLGRNFRTVADLFTKRNLWALAAIRAGILQEPDERLKDALLFSFTSILLKSSRMMAHNNDGIGRIQKGTYYIPQLLHDIHVGAFMEEADGDMRRGYQEAALTNAHLLVSSEDSRHLRLSDNSVDYIFTDPPYSDTVQYGELNFVWEAWLDMDTHWHDREIVVNSMRGLTENDWADGMRAAAGECYRVLKPGRYASLTYHDTSAGTWALLQDIMAEAGFIFADRGDDVLFIDTATKTTNQYFADKVTKRDLVLNFRKPRPGETAAALFTGDEDARTFADKARAFLRDVLAATPGQPADRLYDALVSHMVRRGQFERHNFDALLRSVAEASDGRWYLLDTADVVDAAEAAKEDAAAARLAAFMADFLKRNPFELGVHYSDLFEHYLPVKDKPRRELMVWMREYFYETADGRWRLPRTDEERAAKAALRQSGLLRRIRRFANALIEGVPPHAKDEPANAATAADWLRECRRAGLYAEGVALWERGGITWTALPEVKFLEADEDYQRCRRKETTR